MITDILAQVAILNREIPDEEFDVDTAVETAIDNLEGDETEVAA